MIMPIEKKKVKIMPINFIVLYVLLNTIKLLN